MSALRARAITPRFCSTASSQLAISSAGTSTPSPTTRPWSCPTCSDSVAHSTNVETASHQRTTLTHSIAHSTNWVSLISRSPSAPTRWGQRWRFGGSSDEASRSRRSLASGLPSTPTQMRLPPRSLQLAQWRRHSSPTPSGPSAPATSIARTADQQGSPLGS